MYRLLFVLPLMFVAACTQEDAHSGSIGQDAGQSVDNAAVAPASVEPDMPPSMTATLLDGAWSVVAINGDPSSGLVVSFGPGVAVMSAGCLKRAWTYSRNGGALTLKSNPSGSANCGGGPTAGQEAAFSTFGDSNMAIFSEGGKGVTLSGYGGSMDLKRR